MNLDKLRVFYHAALAKSFSNCGLNLSPSAVSRHVADLEHSMKVKLFSRSPRGIILTSEGEQLLESCRKIFQELEAVRESFTSGTDEVEGLLRIVTPGGWISMIIIQRLKSFMKENPKIRLSIQSTDRTVDFTRNEADISITTVEPDDIELNCAYISSLTMKLYASQSYIEEFGMPITIQELDNHKLIAYGHEKGLMSNLDWHLTVGRKKDAPRVPSLIVNNLYYAGLEGYGIVPLASENKLVKSGKLVPVLPDLDGPIIDAYCVYPARLVKSKKVMAFVEFIREAAEQELGSDDA